MILDFQESPLETGVPRQLNIESVRGKADVLIGVRRSGKSTVLFQIMQRMVDEGIPRQNILYLNFFDDRLHGLKRDSLGQIIEAYFSIYPEKKSHEMVYCPGDLGDEGKGGELGNRAAHDGLDNRYRHSTRSERRQYTEPCRTGQRIQGQTGRHDALVR